MSDITGIDIYELFEISVDASEKEIKRAYRKKALKCHPDKNPDDAIAADRFHKLSKALELLTDAAARSAYDKLLKARKAAELRNRELDSKRRKLKDDLEQRERLANEESFNKIDAAEQMQKELERLKKEGSRQLEEEREFLRQELEKEKLASVKALPRLKLKWKARKEDATNGGYSHDFLSNCFKKYGLVTALFVSKKKNGSALIEFDDLESASNAFHNEIGLAHNPLSLSFIQGEPLPRPSNSKQFDSNDSQLDDFEAMVLKKLHAAAEKQKMNKSS